MTIRQEETTPIGDYFHDSGVFQTFQQLSSTVDDFEVETDKLNAWCDHIVKSIKGLQSHIKACEKEWIKHEQQRSVNDMMHRGAE